MLLLKRTRPLTTLPSSQRKTFLLVTPLFRMASPKLRATAPQQSSFPRLTRSKFSRISQGKCKTCLRSHLLNSKNTCELQKKACAGSLQTAHMARVPGISKRKAFSDSSQMTPQITNARTRGKEAKYLIDIM